MMKKVLMLLFTLIMAIGVPLNTFAATTAPSTEDSIPYTEIKLDRSMIDSRAITEDDMQITYTPFAEGDQLPRTRATYQFDWNTEPGYYYYANVSKYLYAGEGIFADCSSNGQTLTYGLYNHATGRFSPAVTTSGGLYGWINTNNSSTYSFAVTNESSGWVRVYGAFGW